MATTLQNYLNDVRALIHDTNAADFPDSTLINFINKARTRVALDTHCVRSFLSVTGGNALNTIPKQENYIYNGTIGGVTVNNGGTNYTSPSVSFTNAAGDTTGSGAAATAVVSGGVITAINMTNWGVNYTAQPTINITDGAGTGASASATLLSNVLDILSITVLWGQQRIVHEYCTFTMFQTYFRALANQYNVPSVFTLHQGIQQAFLSLIPDANYTMEWDIITLPNPLVNNTDTDLQVIAPWNDAVALFACHLVWASLQNYRMADYWYSGKPNDPGKYDVRIKQLPATAFSRRIFNPYRAFAKRMRRY